MLYIYLLILIHNIFFYLFNTLTILNSNTSINPIVPSIITLIIYVIISIIYRKDKKILIPTAILTIIPIIDITYDLSNNIYNMSYIVDIIGTSYLLYLMILIRKLLITKDINKTIFTTVATILILLLNIFNKNLITGTFIGIISLALIIIGLVKKEYKSLFIVGVIFTIVNIIHKITIISGEFLFWLYLLIAGIALITIVSIKEIKKQKEDKNTNINNM